MSEPEWSPVADDRLAMIIADTVRDEPIGIWSAADVYALAREVMDRRRMAATVSVCSVRKRMVSVPVRPVPYEEDAESTIGGDPISQPDG